MDRPESQTGTGAERSLAPSPAETRANPAKKKKKNSTREPKLYGLVTMRGFEQIVIKVHKQHQTDGLARYFARSDAVRHLCARTHTHTQANTRLNTWFPAGFRPAEIKMAIWVSAFFQFNIILNLMSLLWGLRSDKRIYRNRFRPLWKKLSWWTVFHLLLVYFYSSKKIKWAYTSNRPIKN